MCRYLPSSAVNRPMGLKVYTKAMMNNRILTICAAMAAAMTGTSLAQAQQGYPAQGQVYQGQGYQGQGQVYSTAPGPYVRGGYATDDRRPGEPDFDALDDDDAPNGQNAAALPTPGPVLSPADPVMAARPRPRSIPTVVLRRRQVQFFSRRSALWPRRASRSLSGPRRRCAQRSGDVAGRSALRPPGWTAAGDLWRPSARFAAATTGLFGSWR